MLGGLNYDRAAGVYDETRALPAPVAAKLRDALAAELERAGTDRVLEVGAGTGRVSRPLAELGAHVFGVDISPLMLVRFRSQLGPDYERPDLALADAAHLPLASASFRAAMAFHVLHLVFDWRGALDEVRRILAPGGVFIQEDVTYSGERHWAPSLRKWAEMLAARGFVRRARPSAEEIRAALRELGASCRVETFAEADDRRTPAANMERIRRRIDSWSWEIPDALFDECFKEYETWVPEHYGDVDKALVNPARYDLEVWRFP